MMELKGKSDEEIIEFSKNKKFVIITADIEFGEMFYRYLGDISIICLKSKLQGKKNFIEILDFLHKRDILKQIEVKNFLVIATINDYRIRKFL